MVDDTRSPNAKRGQDEQDETRTQNVGNVSGEADPAGQRAATQQGGKEGAADQAGGVHATRGEDDRPRTSHEEKS